MKLLPGSNTIPNWQIERAKILQRACRSHQAAVNAGKPLGKSLRRLARRYHGRELASNPPHRLKLSALTLRRAWNAWRNGGEASAVFRLHYNPKRADLPVTALVAFVDFCASHQQPYLNRAWERFSTAPIFSRALVKFSNHKLYRYFPAADFRQMQSHLRAIQATQKELEQLCFKVTSNIRFHGNWQFANGRANGRAKHKINFKG